MRVCAAVKGAATATPCAAALRIAETPRLRSGRGGGLVSLPSGPHRCEKT